MIFEGWWGLIRVLVVGVLAYAALIVVLRVSGNRTLSKMNAFDFIITVALGSAFATMILSKTTPLAEGIAALVLLVALQYAVTWMTVRFPRLEALVKAEPVLLMHRGRYLDGVLRQQRVTRAEIEAGLRGAGKASLDERTSVVLEADGSFSIVTQDGEGRETLPPAPEGEGARAG
jgi:uncharacterized membrane protein YcaP (DUF421 family)